MGVFILEELLNVVQDSGIGESLQAEADKAVNNNGVAELGNGKVPVALHKLPLEVTTNGVESQVATEDVHVSSGDGVLGRRGVEVEGDEVVLDDVGIVDGGEGGESNELAVDGLGGEPLIFEDLDVASSVVVETGTPDGTTQRGGNGIGLRVLNPGVESLESLSLDPVYC